MRRFYSLILLAAFLVGVIQPAVPMLNDLLFSRGVVTILVEADRTDADNLPVESNKSQSDNERRGDSQPSHLLDSDYYPVPVKIQPGFSAAILPEVTHPLIILSECTADRYSYPLSPPPRPYPIDT